MSTLYLQALQPEVPETFAFAVPPYLVGQEMYCWMSFVRADGKQVSNSKYLGKIMVL